MKILYALPGNGNGHAARAREILPILKKYAEVDILLNGNNSQVDLGHPIKYHTSGITINYNKNGGIDIWKTITNINYIQLYKYIKKFPIVQYDMVITDCEPISARAAKKQGIPVIYFGHHAAFVSAKTPRPAKKDFFTELIFGSKYIPYDKAIGVHFAKYDENIYTPIIRKEIRSQAINNLGHISVYLFAYHDDILIEKLSKFTDKKFHIFSRFAKDIYIKDNLTVYPINNDNFIKSFVSCEGIITGGGFESPAEALYMGKKILSIPQIGQYEQKCNATALSQLGVKIIEKIDNNFDLEMKDRFDNYKAIKIDYLDQTEEIIKIILSYKK